MAQAHGARYILGALLIVDNIVTVFLPFYLEVLRVLPRLDLKLAVEMLSRTQFGGADERDQFSSECNGEHRTVAVNSVLGSWDAPSRPVILRPATVVRARMSPRGDFLW
jgi:hypothetical protein